MVLKVIKIGELQGFINSSIYKNSYHIPITEQRVISQINNPRADFEDVALIVAINNNEQIIGFIGALPERFSKNTSIKIAWNSCWWVDPKEGGKVAMPLLFKLFSVYGNNIMFRDLTVKTKEIILRLNKFYVIKPINGFKYFLRIDSHHKLPKKHIFFKQIKPVLKIIDTVSDFLLMRFFKYNLPNSFKENKYKVTYLKGVDDECEQFINKCNCNELFKRSSAEINWILTYPWVKESTYNNKERYFFTDTSISFKNYLVKIKSETNELIGVLFLNENNGLVKIPYSYFNQIHKELVIAFIYQFLIDHKASSFVTFNSKIVNELSRKRKLFFHKKRISKEFVTSKNLKEQLNWDFELQDGEGDFVFT